MDTQQKNNLREYASLKTKVAELEEQIKELQPLIIDLVDENQGRINDKELGSFYFTERTTWEYSPKVMKKEQELKDLKKVEELKKIATIKNISRALCYRKDFKE
jgi:hypothetical protein